MREVYADCAATTPLSPAAKGAMEPFFDVQYGNPSSLYAFGQKAKEELECARAKIAALIGAQTKEILFTSGGTEGDNWVLKGTAELRRNKGKHIVTTAIEHHAVLYTAKYLERNGYEVTYLPVDETGRVSVEDLKAALREDTILISCMAANNEIGTIEPIAEIGEIAKEHDILFHVDAVQALGHIPVNVRDWHCDFMTFSAHKFYGPSGVGGLFIREGLRLPPLIHGGGQERGMRSGTENVAGVVGMAAALEECIRDMPEELPRLSHLRDRLLDTLSRLPYTKVTGSREDRLPGIASLVFEGVEGEALLLRLDEKGIRASSGSACSSASLDPSHVLLATGLPHEVAHGSLRMSLGRYTTEEDVDYLLKEVPETVEYLRKMSPVWENGRPVWYQ